MEIRKRHGINWSPRFFYIDFDQTSIIAIQNIFPLALIRICYFHLKQAILRRSSSLHGKQASYWLESEFTRFWLAVEKKEQLEPFLKVNIFSCLSKKLFIAPFSKKKDFRAQFDCHSFKIWKGACQFYGLLQKNFCSWMPFSTREMALLWAEAILLQRFHEQHIRNRKSCFKTRRKFSFWSPKKCLNDDPPTQRKRKNILSRKTRSLRQKISVMFCHSQRE